MQYNEIYPLIKNTIKWLQENYPHDTYFVISSKWASLQWMGSSQITEQINIRQNRS